MGNRYIIVVKCPKCGLVDDDVWFAPTCGYDEWICWRCTEIVDLYEYTGISYEDASNADELDKIVHDMNLDYDPCG